MDNVHRSTQKVRPIGTKEEVGQLWVRLDAALREAEAIQIRFEEIIAALSMGGAARLADSYLEDVDHFSEAIRNGRALAKRATKEIVEKNSLRTAIVDIRLWNEKMCELGGIKTGGEKSSMTAVESLEHHRKRRNPDGKK